MFVFVFVEVGVEGDHSPMTGRRTRNDKRAIYKARICAFRLDETVSQVLVIAS